MITATHNRLDATYMACQENISFLAASTDQAWADVNTLASAINDTDSILKAAMQEVNDARKAQDKFQANLRDLESGRKEVDVVKHELEQVNTDGQVAEFLLNYTKSDRRCTCR